VAAQLLQLLALVDKAAAANAELRIER